MSFWKKLFGGGSQPPTPAADKESVLARLNELLNQLTGLKKSADDYDTEACITRAEMLILCFRHKDSEDQAMQHEIKESKKDAKAAIAQRQNSNAGKILRDIFKLIYPGETV